MQTKARAVKKHRTTTIAYIVLRVLVIAILVRAVIFGHWDQVFYCALSLVLFMVPSLVEKELRIELPSTLEIIVLLFIFAGEILGEIGEFYNKIMYWDVMLHTVNGFLMAAIGVALIDVFNKHPKINFSLSPFFVAFVAFCFSMTIGVLWEFGEYSADRFLHADMQKDTIIRSINSWELESVGEKPPLYIDKITQTVITGTFRGESEQIVINGYLDIGLHDTMEDMFVNLVGALVFSIIAALYIKGRGKGNNQVAQAFIPRMLTEEEFEEMSSEKSSVKEIIQSYFKL